MASVGGKSDRVASSEVEDNNSHYIGIIGVSVQANALHNGAGFQNGFYFSIGNVFTMLKFDQIFFPVNNSNNPVGLYLTDVTSTEPTNLVLIVKFFFGFFFVEKIAHGNVSSSNMNFSSGIGLVGNKVVSLFPVDNFDTAVHQRCSGTSSGSILRSSYSSTSGGLSEAIALHEWHTKTSSGQRMSVWTH